ncbi:ABC transporter permease [Fusibacter bizertensis]
MNAFIAFTKKEMMESVRTYKFYILATVFLLFGFMNPIIAKIMPDLLSSLMPDGMTITLSTPTAIDAWAQFFKNGSQMGILILVVMFSGIMANEFIKGTLVNILTKGMARPTVIFSKLTAASIQWSVSYLLCIAITYGYTAYFWTMNGVENLFLSLFGLWLFGELMIGLVILGGILFKSMYGSLLFAGGLVVVMTVLSIFPQLMAFNPMTLASANMALITGAQDVSKFLSASVVTFLGLLLSILTSVMVFNKKQI